ncbi:MAG: terminase small subunit [Pedobacter sp.]|uniref:terminase small subunit n=1 Tax=Pedobacter sp. TaxID=1411316 RepID=UPI0035693251
MAGIKQPKIEQKPLITRRAFIRKIKHSLPKNYKELGFYIKNCKGCDDPHCEGWTVAHKEPQEKKIIKIEGMPDKVKGNQGPKGSSKYTDEFIEAEADALDKWLDVIATDPITGKQGKLNFWLGSFASDRGYYRQLLTEFAAKNEKFHDIYKKAKQTQENRMIHGAIRNNLNPTMVIFALKNVAGWRDKQEVEHSNPAGKPFEINIITNEDMEKRITELESRR